MHAFPDDRYGRLFLLQLVDGGVATHGTEPQQRGRVGALAVDQPGVREPVASPELLQRVGEQKRIGRSHVDAVHLGAPGGG